MSEDVTAQTSYPHPTWPTLLWRGLTKRCARCGSGHIYDGWFHMKERCPTCGFLFEREPGFFVGAYLVNFAVVIVLLFITCMGFVAWKAANPDAGVVVPLTACMVISLVVPVFFYPFSRTIWSALHLGSSQLEPHEIDAAEAFLRGDPVPASSLSTGSIGPRAQLPGDPAPGVPAAERAPSDRPSVPT